MAAGAPVLAAFARLLPAAPRGTSCGLVRTQKVGRIRTCSLNPVTLRSAESWISARRTFRR